jgi:hypothetical protein
MRKAAYLILTGFFGTALALAAPQQKTFTGHIGDAMCGLKHGMEGQSDKDCTLMCVKAGSEYILADREAGKVYKLSDQKTPEKFAGQKVKVTGALKGDTIEVASIEAAK